MRYIFWIIFFLLISCQSPIYQYEDGEWNKSMGKEVAIIIQIK